MDNGQCKVNVIMSHEIQTIFRKKKTLFIDQFILPNVANSRSFITIRCKLMKMWYNKMGFWHDASWGSNYWSKHGAECVLNERLAFSYYLRSHYSNERSCSSKTHRRKYNLSQVLNHFFDKIQLSNNMTHLPVNEQVAGCRLQVAGWKIYICIPR